MSAKWSTTLACALLLATSLPIALVAPPTGIVEAATPAVGQAVSKPANLPARLPWQAGDTHSWGWSYNTPGSDHMCTPSGAQDCYALDVDGLTTASRIYPVFAGKVVYEGCATYGWAHYGHIVYIETNLDGHRYEALYTHLSSAIVQTGDSVGINEQIGFAGETVTTPIDDPKGCLATADVDATMGIHLHFAMYRDAVFQNSAGRIGPHDGNPVIPEPLIGKDGAYENFQWWSGPMTAVDLMTGTSSPSGVWKSDAQADAKSVAYGKKVRLSVHVQDNVDIKEVLFTAYYPGWSDPKNTTFNGFPNNAIWRVLAVCRPNGSGTATGSCTWSGSARSADVTFDWSPSTETGLIPAVVDWLPAAQPAVGKTIKDPVSVCLSFDIVSTAGIEKLAPNGVHGGACGG